VPTPTIQAKWLRRRGEQTWYCQTMPKLWAKLWKSEGQMNQNTHQIVCFFALDVMIPQSEIKAGDTVMKSKWVIQWWNAGFPVVRPPGWAMTKPFCNFIAYRSIRSILIAWITSLAQKIGVVQFAWQQSEVDMHDPHSSCPFWTVYMLFHHICHVVFV